MMMKNVSAAVNVSESRTLCIDEKAAELLGKHYGMFGGKSESGGGDVIIVDNIEKAEQIKERKNAVQS